MVASMKETLEPKLTNIVSNIAAQPKHGHMWLVVAYTSCFFQKWTIIDKTGMKLDVVMQS